MLAFLAGCAGPGVIVRPDDRPGMPAAIFFAEARGHAARQGVVLLGGLAHGERRAVPCRGAHGRAPNVPLQSWVRVTNERNHKWVIVRINDRGPYIRGRIIDLSRGAARQIGMIGDGVVPVRVELLKRINVVEKPNLKLTPKIRREAEARLQQRLRAKKQRQSH